VPLPFRYELEFFFVGGIGQLFGLFQGLKAFRRFDVTGEFCTKRNVRETAHSRRLLHGPGLDARVSTQLGGLAKPTMVQIRLLSV
jgi:hypothetical protein